MTDPIRRPVSQVRAGDLISLEENGTVLVVCAVSQPVGASRRADLVDARTGLPVPWVRLGLHDAVLTHEGRAEWITTVGAPGDVMLGAADLVAQDAEVLASWPVEIDLFGRPGWEQVAGDESVVDTAAA